MRIGIHTSISSKSLASAVEKTLEFGTNTLQIFSASPRMWAASPLDAAQCRDFADGRRCHNIGPLVVHGSYLVNLASLEKPTAGKSLAAFRAELERCAALQAEYLVIHPGSSKGNERSVAMERIADAVAAACEHVENPPMLLLENTAGQGNCIGNTFEELAALRKLINERCTLPVGYCLDTAHCLASGYDVATSKGLRATVAEIESTLGLENVRVIHTNDSKVPLGAKLDRHEHIGRGHIGLDGFKRILTHPALREKPFILETPVDETGDERTNIEALKQLCPKSSTNPRK